LADPYLLGSAAGASLGVVVVLAMGGLVGWLVPLASASAVQRVGLVGAAFGGALIGVGLTVLLARGAHDTLRLLLAGIVVGIALARPGGVARVAWGKLAHEVLLGRGIVLLVGASYFVIHGLVLYKWRLTKLIEKDGSRFDDRLGPYMFCVLLVAVVVSLLATAAYDPDPFTCAWAVSSCPSFPSRGDLAAIRALGTLPAGLGARAQTLHASLGVGLASGALMLASGSTVARRGVGAACTGAGAGLTGSPCGSSPMASPIAATGASKNGKSSLLPTSTASGSPVSRYTRPLRAWYGSNSAPPNNCRTDDMAFTTA
jgi:hypothetical protein